MSPHEHPPFPPCLEAFWLEQMADVTGFQQEDTAWLHLGRAIQALSDGFTTQRPIAFQDYFRLPINRLAYGLFFFPQTWQRTRFALDELLRFWGWAPIPGDAAVSILDIGSGTGAAALATADLLAQSHPTRPVHLHLADHSHAALREAHELLLAGQRHHLFTDVNLHTHTGDAARPGVAAGAQHEDGFDLILLSFALNELGMGAGALPILQELTARLRPGGLLLLIEPATRRTSENLMGLQQQLCETTGCHPWGPHLHGLPCPLLESGGRFWQHEVRSWDPPSSLIRANRKLWREVEHLKFTWAAAGPASPVKRPAPDSSMVRLVSPMGSVKGRLLFSAIGADGQRHDFDIQTRSLEKSHRTWLCRIERGAILKIEKPRALKKPNTWRIESPASISRVYPEDRPCP